jgi:glucose-1-phosphate cytidylyltransferase
MPTSAIRNSCCASATAQGTPNFFLTYQEAASNDFVMRGDRVELMHSDISAWSITFVDTGLEWPIARAA